MAARSQIAETLNALKHTLEDLADRGHRGFDCSDGSLEKLAEWGAAPQLRCENLKHIRLDLGDCQRCRLARDRKNIVFGAGSSSAKIVFVGEGPGFEEDQQGKPFVGAAGQLLTKIIAAIKHTRDDVYICNIIKCRPPGNRNPEPDEIETCVPFLRRQVSAVQPGFIVALGAVAAQRGMGRFFDRFSCV